jgi:hypothetical protein
MDPNEEKAIVAITSKCVEVESIGEGIELYCVDGLGVVEEQ